MDFDLLLRLSAILMFVTIQVYWQIIKREAIKTKRKTKNKFKNLEKISMGLVAVFILFTLMGFTTLTFNNIIFQLFGQILIMIGCAEAILGRHALGTNWTESYEYQIKKEHQLIKDGIYKYVRHPIYGGLMIAVTGAFIVAQTYLFIPVFIFQLIVMMFLAKREECLLRDFFGKRYELYMQTTKMFIPFIF